MEPITFDPEVLEEIRAKAPEIGPAEAMSRFIQESITFDFDEVSD